MAHLSTERLERQKQIFKGYFLGRNMHQSLHAMDLALKHHIGLRKDGEMEITHQFYIVSYLLQLMEHKIPFEEYDDLISASFLHDLVEDYGGIYSCEDVMKGFGDRVFEVVCLLTKTEGYNKRNADDVAYYYDNMLKNYATPIIKAVDRIHNFQSMIEVFSVAKRERYMDEVREYFFPMLKSACERFPIHYFVFVSLKNTLERQLYLIGHINNLEKLYYEDKTNE